MPNTTHSPTLSTIPGPAGILGVLPKLSHRPLDTLCETAARYGGLVRLGPRFYLLTHPTGVQHVMLDNAANYNKGANLREIKMVIGEGLLTSSNPLWLKQRRLIQPLFHRKHVHGFADDIARMTLDMCEAWESHAGRGQPLDVANEMMRLTRRIITETIFGTGELDIDMEAVGEAVGIVVAHIGEVEWSLFMPFSLPTGRFRRFKKALALLDDTVYAFIAHRQNNPGQGGDILSLLLSTRDEDGQGMPITQIRDEIMTMFLAGHETTATALNWFWYLQAQHPEVEMRLDEEITAVLGGRLPTLAELPQLAYVRQVFEETMRLYPPAWLFFRTPLENDVVCGYQVPAGSVLALCPYITHRHPEFWALPERFDPGRFLDKPVPPDARFSYFPFGGGPRLCIGKEFAMMESLLIISIILQRYRLRSLPGHKAVPAQPSAILRPQNGMPLLIARR